MSAHSFNTLNAEIKCPVCGEKVASGIGFQVGALEKRLYKIGDKLNWQGEKRRPNEPPAAGNIRTIGYFNCDNPTCGSWLDCYPEVQLAVIVIENNKLTSVEIYNEQPGKEMFEILELS